MTNVLILGAAGHIARHAEADLLKDSQAHLTYFLRNAGRLTITDASRETRIEGDVTDANATGSRCGHRNGSQPSQTPDLDLHTWHL
jgi:nucleoside-diphosphate-sugar epimerase